MKEEQTWYNIFDAGTLELICSMVADKENPITYDPRINEGKHGVIWQVAENPTIKIKDLNT